MRFLLYPIALIYGTIIRLRNFLYNRKFLKSVSFKTPVILVGNLTTGGTGKTPCVEYLINLLRTDYNIAVLSRGYKRKTKGFIIGNVTCSTSNEIGDEAMQILSKFQDVTVAVCENRKVGIKNLIHLKNPPDVIIMDDGFQHRRVKPGLSILLTDYIKPYSNDYLLPTGNLREHCHNSKRADIIIVTRSPNVHSPISEKIIIKQLKPQKQQPVFFSYLGFGKLMPFGSVAEKNRAVKQPNTIILFTGIANTAILEQHLQDRCSNLIVLKFPDHHWYADKDIARILKTYDDQFTKNKIIVTTEKDYYRLKHKKCFDDLRKKPVFYIPVSMKIHPHTKGIDFNQAIRDYVEKNRKHFELDSTTN